MKLRDTGKHPVAAPPQQCNRSKEDGNGASWRLKPCGAPDRLLDDQYDTRVNAAAMSSCQRLVPDLAETMV